MIINNYCYSEVPHVNLWTTNFSSFFSKSIFQNVKHINKNILFSTYSFRNSNYKHNHYFAYQLMLVSSFLSMLIYALWLNFFFFEKHIEKWRYFPSCCAFIIVALSTCLKTKIIIIFSTVRCSHIAQYISFKCLFLENEEKNNENWKKNWNVQRVRLFVCTIQMKYSHSNAR